MPYGRTIALILMSTLLGAIAGISGYVASHKIPPASTDGPGVVSFEEVGRDYLPQLGKAYAGAWEDGAKSLDSGQSPEAALAVVAASWSSNRGALFDRVLASKFAAIVPESTAAADVTAASRAALAAAWRGVAKGLAP